MSFDVAVGVSQHQLNNCSAQLFTRIPTLFSGDGTADKFPGITMHWAATQAPTFNLSPTKAAVEALHQQAFEIHSEGLQALAIPHEALAAAAANLPAFDVIFPNLQITLKQSNGEQTVLNLNVTLSCLLSVSGNDLKLAASSASFAPLQDPMQQFFASNVVMPQLVTAANKALAGLSIPPPQMPGIQLSPIAATVANGAIIAVTNIISKGPASVPGGYPWPSNDFFALLSQDALQAVTLSAIGQTKNVSGSGSVGSSAGGADYHYSINITNPRVSLQGENLVVDFGIDGNVGAKVTVLWVPIGVNYDVQGGPAPQATCQLVPAGGSNMNIIARSLNAFTFLLKPSGSPLEWIISAITWPITQAITAVVTPIVTTTLRDINFTSYNLPNYGVNISGVQMNFKPTVSGVSGNGQYLIIGGGLSVS
jgi:hypothetical protein